MDLRLWLLRDQAGNARAVCKLCALARLHVCDHPYSQHIPHGVQAEASHQQFVPTPHAPGAGTLCKISSRTAVDVIPRTRAAGVTMIRCANVALVNSLTSSGMT